MNKIKRNYEIMQGLAFLNIPHINYSKLVKYCGNANNLHSTIGDILSGEKSVNFFNKVLAFSK